MDLQDKDRIGQYLTAQLSEMVFDELSAAYLKKAGIADIMTGVPVPIRKTELGSISTLAIARNMAFVIGCDPSFRYKENYIAYVLRAFDKRFAEGLIADGVEVAAGGNYEYACIQFRAAMQIDPENANAYYCYGRACKDAYEQGDEEERVGRFKAESLEAFEIATIKNPQLAEAFYFLGYGYVNLGLYIKAKLTWDEFMKLSTDEELKKEIAGRLAQLVQPIEIEKGYNMVLSGKYEEGIEALLPYTEGQYASWWPLWYYLGAAYAGLEQDEEAEKDFLQVLKYSPSNIEAMDELVKIYERLGNEEKALKYRTKLEIVRENAAKDKAEAELAGLEGTMHC